MRKLGTQCLCIVLALVPLALSAQASDQELERFSVADFQTPQQATQDAALAETSAIEEVPLADFLATVEEPAATEEPVALDQPIAAEATATVEAVPVADETATGAAAGTAAEYETSASAELDVISLPPAPVAESTLKEDARHAQIEEVIVTATKRAQVQREIPSSMAVLGGEKLEQLGLRKVKDIFALVPGINMQDEIAGIQRKISVRGVGPDTGTNQTVGSVLGDIPISDPYGATTIVDPNPWDMRTVEVLKGPQGSLFGATSLAGLIRYVPNAPALEQWQGKAFYDYTTVDRGSSAPSYGAAINIPIGSRIALRASGIYQELPGVIDSNNPSRQQEDVDTGLSWSGRVIALWQPSDRLTVNAMYMKEARRADDMNLVTLADGTYSRNDAPQGSPSENGFRITTLDIRYDFDWATLASISGYQEKNSFNLVDTSYLVQPLARLGLSFLHAERMSETQGVMQELRLISPDDGALTWLAGVYFGTYSQKIQGNMYIPGTTILSPLAALLPPPLRSLLTENGLTISSTGYDPLKATEYAVFGEANYDFTDSFRLTLGSRLYQTEVEGIFLAGGVSSGNNGKELRSSEKGWSPKIALTYRPWADILLYGTVSRGFQFGGFNLPTLPTPKIPLTFESSTLWNYEIGVRTDWFDRTLRADISAFFLDWKNPQIKQADGTGLNSFVDNVGGTHNIGVEATIRWLTPLDGLAIEQTASYIEARTSETFLDVSGEEIPEGTLMPSSPLVQAVTSLSYTQPFGAYMTQTSLINSLQGKAWTGITHETSVGDFSLLSFNFNITRTDLRWAPSLNIGINNITNVQKIVAGFGTSSGPTGMLNADALVATSSYVYTQPRSIVVRLSAEF